MTLKFILIEGSGQVVTRRRNSNRRGRRSCKRLGHAQAHLEWPPGRKLRGQRTSENSWRGPSGNWRHHSGNFCHLKQAWCFPPELNKIHVRFSDFASLAGDKRARRILRGPTQRQKERNPAHTPLWREWVALFRRLIVHVILFRGDETLVRVLLELFSLTKVHVLTTHLKLSSRSRLIHFLLLNTMQCYWFLHWPTKSVFFLFVGSSNLHSV